MHIEFSCFVKGMFVSHRPTPCCSSQLEHKTFIAQFHTFSTSITHVCWLHTFNYTLLYACPLTPVATIIIKSFHTTMLQTVVCRWQLSSSAHVLRYTHSVRHQTQNVNKAIGFSIVLIHCSPLRSTDCVHSHHVRVAYSQTCETLLSSSRS